MTPKRPRVVFVSAAGPRRGFGHLVRCRSLARALGVKPVVALRGGRAAQEAARLLGCRIRDPRPGETLRAERPDVLVIDDPVLRATSPWRRAARQARVPVCSIHDLAIGVGDADLLVDASLSTLSDSGRTDGSRLLGPSFAVLSCPTSAFSRRPDPDAGRQRLLIALGGGPRLGFSLAVAREVRRLEPEAEVVIAGGFGGPVRRRTDEGITVLGPQQSLAGLLSEATICVVGGGVTLYEACCQGVPAVAVSVVAAQNEHITAFAERGAVVDGGAISLRPRMRDERALAIARHVSRLFRSPVERRLLAAAGRSVVDGHGAMRVAAQIQRLARRRCACEEAL